MSERPAGLSIRLKLALSYAIFLMAAAWATFLAVVAVVLQHVPSGRFYLFGVGSIGIDRGGLIRLAMPYALAGTALLAVIGLGGGWLLAGRMLRPLASISGAALAAAGGSLSHRIRLPGPDDELRRLADVFDEMLARLEHSFEEQRRFTANASHELRTPHAAMKTILDVARLELAGTSGGDDADARLDERLGQLQELNERSITMIETLLRLARVDRGHLELARCDLVSMVRECAADVEHAPGRRVRTELVAAEVVADPQLLRHLVANLLSNAERHNLPEDGFITVRVASEGALAWLEVENSGAVITPAMAATLTEPFVRAAGRVAERGAVGRGSSGLGLTLVDSITRAHGGTLTLKARTEGGLLVRVTLPRAT